MKLDYKHIRHAEPTQKSTAKRSLKVPAIVLGVLCFIVGLSILFSSSPIKAHVDAKGTHSLAPNTSSITLALPHLSDHADQNEKENVAIPPASRWQEMKVKSGDTFGQLASANGIKAREVMQLINTSDDLKKITHIRPGETIRFHASDDGKLLSLEFDLNDTERVTAKRQADGSFISKKIVRTYDVRENRASGMIKSSFYGAALSSGISDNIIMQMADIFGYDIDFTLDIRKGDRFNVVWNEYYRDGVKVKDGDILAAEFINNGRTVRAVRYENEKGQSDYYTPEGKSLKKAFIRNPVHFSHISSKFNLARVHPLFKTARPHRGVDYAAKTGTPIFAAGDGKVIFRGVKRGYGNVIIIRHAGSKFTTLYAHMSKFNSKAKLNSYVKQGQTIGYVGKTGWATGPHLHYEFRVNGVHKNPLTVKLPSAQPLAKKHMARFTQQAQVLLKQLRVMDEVMLAQSKKNSTL